MRRHVKAAVAGGALLLLIATVGATLAMATAPVISVGSTKAQPLSTEATLSAAIDPGGLETTYRFEYGTTTAYGQSTAPRTIKAGSGPVAVKASLFGLTPATTYHFRVLAANDDGSAEGADGQFTTTATGGADSCPNAAVRAQQSSAFLPDCRAYEMITQADKGGGTIALGAATGAAGLVLWNGAAASRNGERIAYSAWIPLANGQGGMPLTYRAQRGPAGWASEAVSPRPRDPGAVFQTHFAGWEKITPDLEIGYGDSSQESFDPTDINGVVDIYRTGPNEETELVSRGNGAERLGPGQGAREAIVGISEDGSHLLFGTGAHLVPEDAERSNEPLIFDVYDRTRGHTYLVNQDNSGELLNKCGSALGAGSSFSEHAVSADGSKVFFQVPVRLSAGAHPDCKLPAQLYMRVNNAETVHISASQRTEPDPGGVKAASYEGASVDGSLVFFKSGELLTDDATTAGGVYRYDTESGDLELVVPQRTPENVALAINVVRVAPDGSRVYFIAQNPIDGKGAAGKNNLFVWGEAGIDFIATGPTIQFRTDLIPAARARTMLALTSDGSHALFATKSALTPFANQNYYEAYLYDAEEGRLTCISCDPAGQRPPGSVARSNARVPNTQGRDTPISADGEVAVFETGDRLVPGDVNNRLDVYQYRDGRLSLITPGRADVDSYLIGSGPSGNSVFFGTFASLVGADRDGGDLDLYVARVGGGFLEAEPPTVRPPCEGEGCQGALAAPPAQGRPGSATVSGPGNAKGRSKAKSRKRAQKSCKRAGAKQAKRGTKQAKRAKAKSCRKAAAPSHNARKGR